ncbi:MAG: thiaminase II [Clostridium sp.]|uniref:thiaminase II n=1 Tax=Clostridium sp. TaxID=1506 RepID=UPI003F31C700
MKFTDYLFEESREIFDEYLEHPFLKEIGEGTLDKEKFKEYLIQDYLYLKEYAKVFCVGVIKAESMDEMRFFYNSIKGTMEDETAVHIKYLEGFNVSTEKAENSKIKLINTSYTSYMLGQALTGDIYDIIAAVLPCTWSYSYIGKKLLGKYKNKLENNFYKEWIEMYACEEYDEFTELWINYTNEKCKDLSKEKKEKLKDIFIKSSVYEMQFWDMAYEKCEEK